MAFGRARRQHGSRKEAAEDLAPLDARRQVAETVERMRDVGDGITAGDDGHRRHLGVLPVAQQACDGFVEGQGAPMPMRGGHDQMLGAGAVFRAVGGPPGDVPALGVAPDLRGDAAEPHVGFADRRRHRFGELLHAAREADHLAGEFGRAPKAVEHRSVFPFELMDAREAVGHHQLGRVAGVDARDDRIHEQRGGFRTEASRGERFDGFAGVPALGTEGFGEQAEFPRPAQQAGRQDRERIATEAMEFAVGEEVAFRRAHVGGLRDGTEPVGAQQRFVLRSFELQGVRTRFHQPAVFLDCADGTADPGGRLDDLHLRTGADHGVGDGQSGRSSSQYDRVEHHGRIIDRER